MKKLQQKLSDIVSHSTETGSVPAYSVVDGPIPNATRKYVIHGWRWHTMSVLRDLDRFSHMLVTKPNRSLLSNAYDFVITFNLGALMRVEKEIFIPWLKQMLKGNTMLEMHIADMERHHRHMADLSKEVVNIISSQPDTLGNGKEFDFKLDNLEKIITEMKSSVLKVQLLQVR